MDLQVDRFIASRAIALVLQGVPGAYLPSLLGAQNDLDSALESGEPRSINRKSYDENALVDKLRDRSSSTYKVATRFRELTEKRIATPAFHPNGPQRVLMRHPAVFSLVRTSPDGRQRVLALTNVSREAQEATFSETELGTSARTWRDILAAARWNRIPGPCAPDSSPTRASGSHRTNPDPTKNSSRIAETTGREHRIRVRRCVHRPTERVVGQHVDFGPNPVRSLGFTTGVAIENVGSGLTQVARRLG